LTEPLPVTIRGLCDETLLRAQAFHFFGTAEYIEEQVHDLITMRAPDPTNLPFVVWEPHARSCRPDTLHAHKNATRLVDVFSPNHEELSSFFGSCSDFFDKEMIEKQADAFVHAGIGSCGEGCMVVRAAAHGCLIQTRNREPIWLPSFYAPGSCQVVEPTGAGNAFLGGFVIGWQETGSYTEAASHGQVAASFAIEQIGLPSVDRSHGTELWNGDRVRARLEDYRRRI